MTDLTDLMRKGLDEALEQHVVKLFNVVMVDPTEQAIERFRNGIAKSLTVYDTLLAIIEE
jgi:hypothetical protein